MVGGEKLKRKRSKKCQRVAGQRQQHGSAKNAHELPTQRQNERYREIKLHTSHCT